MNKFQKSIINSLNQILKKKIDESNLEIPPNPEMGDYAFPCFTLAKEFKKSPNEIAKELVAKIKSDNNIKDIKVLGPYINFFVNKGLLTKDTLNIILSDGKDYGSLKNNKTIMVEYSEPNTNKPLHVGHLRNTILGHSLSLILKKTGNRVIQANLINDRGIHICKSMLAYQKWGTNKDPDKKSDHFVGDFYVLYSKNATEELDNENKEMLKKWESGDKKVMALWKKMNKWALDGFMITYKNLGIKFDKYYYESKFYKKAKDIVIKAFDEGIFTKDENGNYIAELGRFNLPNKVVLRADGTSVYITQDLYLAQLKFKDYKLDKSIYVVGNEQNLHFNQLFKILELLGYKWVDKCYHLSYGMILLKGGKMKSREGTIVDGDELIDGIINLAEQEIKKRYKNISKEDMEKRARIIGLGALRFFMLKYDPAKDFIYHPEESISFEGETGPYVQYSHARICSVFKKHGKKLEKNVDFNQLKHELEVRIITLLGNFPETVKQAADNYKPSLITRYLLDLSQAFNEFYHECPILTAEQELKNARLLLIDCVRQVIKNGLSLLGIDAPEEM